MKLLLTSAGVKNPTIRDALVDLLGRPIAESTALCIPTAMYGHPGAGLERAWEFVSGRSHEPMVELGWKSVGLLELAALPSLPATQWVPLVQQADVLLVSGGDALYLAHWVRQSGLADLLPSLERTVWLGMSAGSMVMAPSVGEDFIQWRPPGLEDRALGLVDFAICPHVVTRPDLPGNSVEEATSWAAAMPCAAYAIDDDTAIRVVDGQVDVVSEGYWRHFPTDERDLR
jgi:dipeptidase E